MSLITKKIREDGEGKYLRPESFIEGRRARIESLELKETKATDKEGNPYKEFHCVFTDGKEFGAISFDFKKAMIKANPDRGDLLEIESEEQKDGKYFNWTITKIKDGEKTSEEKVDEVEFE